MEFNRIRPDDRDPGAEAQPDFGMLRAWIAARQQALPTVRVLARVDTAAPAQPTDPMAAIRAILTGHSPLTPPAGHFSYRYANGQTCASQGENHA